MKRTMILLFGYIFILTVMFHAKDRRDVEELLTYFPAGDYVLITHRDYDRIESSSLYDLYCRRQQMTEDARGIAEEDLGDFYHRLLAECESVTAATRMEPKRYKTRVKLEEGQTGRDAVLEVIKTRFSGASDVSFENEITEETREVVATVTRLEPQFLWVYRGPALKKLVERADDDGELKRSSWLLEKIPVFEVSIGRLYYAFLTKTGDLIMAESFEMLKKMFDADIGYEEGILTAEDYQGLPEIVPDLGPVWKFYNATVDRQRFWKQELRSKLSGASLKRRDEWYDSKPLGIYTGISLDSGIHRVHVQEFRSEEYAKKYDANIASLIKDSWFSENTVAATEDYEEKKENKMEREIEGRFIYERVLVDSELFKAELEMNRAWRDEGKPHAVK